jgi:hypothetical protein
MKRLMLSGLALLVVFAMAPPVAAAGAGTAAPWVIEPVPVTPTDAGVLSAVSCLPDGTCTAVGNAGGDEEFINSLIEHWDGTTWTQVPSPNVRGSRSDTILTAVSCSDDNDCLAVGYFVASTATNVAVDSYAAVWNGTTWAAAVPPHVGDKDSSSSLSGVSCLAPDDCEAVGGFQAGNVIAESRPIALLWNGSAWVRQPVANPQAENGSNLSAVDCTSATSCVAVGNYAYADIANAVFAEQWNGGGWSLDKQANPGGNDVNIDSGVSCRSVTHCVSVGQWMTVRGASEPLVERSTGRNWQQVSVPAPDTDDPLNAVDCDGPATCFAVGSSAATISGSPAQTFVETLAGRTWRVQPTPNPAGAQDSELLGVSCWTPRDCMAVGQSAAASGQPHALAELHVASGS